LVICINIRDRGKRLREGPRFGTIDDRIENSYKEMKRRAENRDDWRYFMSKARQRMNNDDVLI